jgi:O-antigen/teichoic acid export membrane protein
LKKYWKNLCLYILPCFVIAFCIARPFFSFVFGESWKASGVYFQYILPWMFMMMMVSPINFLPIVFGKQKELLFLEGFFLILRFSALYLGVATNNFQTSIVLFSTVGFFFSLVLFFWFYSLIKAYEKRIESFSDKK